MTRNKLRRVQREWESIGYCSTAPSMQWCKHAIARPRKHSKHSVHSRLVPSPSRTGACRPRRELEAGLSQKLAEALADCAGFGLLHCLPRPPHPRWVRSRSDQSRWHLPDRGRWIMSGDAFRIHLWTLLSPPPACASRRKTFAPPTVDPSLEIRGGALILPWTW